MVNLHDCWMHDVHYGVSVVSCGLDRGSYALHSMTRLPSCHIPRPPRLSGSGQAAPVLALRFLKVYSLSLGTR
jgi:hypothetical protein